MTPLFNPALPRQTGSPAQYLIPPAPPLHNKPCPQVFERVVLHDARPPLPPGMPEPFELLMTSCWHSDPLRRPAFDSVLRWGWRRGSCGGACGFAAARAPDAARGAA
jgi:hypothetical protein